MGAAHTDYFISRTMRIPKEATIAKMYFACGVWRSANWRNLMTIYCHPTYRPSNCLIHEYRVLAGYCKLVFMNPPQRFSDRFKNYTPPPPGYPPAILDTLRAECGLTP